MKVQFYVSIGLAHDVRETFDTVADLGLDEGEWESLSEEAQEEHLKDWLGNHLSFGWKPLD